MHADEAAVRELIQPLGLAPKRAPMLIRFCRDYVEKEVRSRSHTHIWASTVNRAGSALTGNTLAVYPRAAVLGELTVHLHSWWPAGLQQGRHKAIGRS